MDPSTYSFARLFAEQKKYNQKIRSENGDNTELSWMQTYIIGLVSEVDEILGDLNWKRHRRQNKVVDRENLAYELADMTKYILSMWELYGFTYMDVLKYVSIKSEMLDYLYAQEHCEDPVGKRIIITDIDGTIGDWRTTFMDTMREIYRVDVAEDAMTSLRMDEDLSLSYPEYAMMKDQFESSGGYGFIKPYPDAISCIRSMQESGALIIVNTARPVGKYHRIWIDTWEWLINNGIIPFRLLMKDEDRVSYAVNLAKENDVIIFEDDPGMAMRFAASGLQVYLRSQRYNESIVHKKISRVDTYSELGETAFSSE